MTKSVEIETDYVTLGQFLKEEGIISTGGQAKWFLAEANVQVNDEAEARRGRKLYPGDTIVLTSGETFVIEASQV